MYSFYCFSSDKKIIISDQPLEWIKKKFGYRFEIVNTVKDKDSIDIISERLKRSYPNFEFEQRLQKTRAPLSDEARKKLSESKLGKPRDAATRAKISAALKGRSNFQGKSHSPETRAVMAERKLGNQHAKDKIWAHNPHTDNEIRVNTLIDIPDGYIKGRDYYSTEPGFYYFKERLKS